MFACRFSTVTPQSFVLGGQSSSAMWVQGLGEGEGSARVLTSVADSFLGASWHAGIPWMGISEHMSKTFNANEDIYTFDVRLKEVLQLFTHSSNFKAWESRPHRVTVQIQSVVFILYFILLCTVDLKLCGPVLCTLTDAQVQLTYKQTVEILSVGGQHASHFNIFLLGLMSHFKYFYGQQMISTAAFLSGEVFTNTWKADGKYQFSCEDQQTSLKQSKWGHSRKWEKSGHWFQQKQGTDGKLVMWPSGFDDCENASLMTGRGWYAVRVECSPHRPLAVHNTCSGRTFAPCSCKWPK